MKKLIQAYKAIKARTSHRPILSHALVSNGMIEFTNLETTVILPSPVTGAENILIPFVTLEKCEKLGFKTVRYDNDMLVDDESGISVDIQSITTKHDEWPEIKREFSSDEINTNTISYKDVEAVGVAMACERSRYAINSIAVYSNGSIAATDGRRLHIVGNVSKGQTPAMLPGELIKLSKIFKFEEALIETQHEGEIAVISGDFGKIIFRALSGRYPDIAGIIPKKKQPLKIDIEKLTPILKKIIKIRRDGDPGGVHFNSGISWNGINFPFQLPKGLDHYFNASYLVDAFKATGAKNFSLSKDTSAVVKIHNGKNVVVMTPINTVQ